MLPTLGAMVPDASARRNVTTRCAPDQHLTEVNAVSVDHQPISIVAGTFPVDCWQEYPIGEEAENGAGRLAHPTDRDGRHQIRSCTGSGAA